MPYGVDERRPTAREDGVDDVEVRRVGDALEDVGITPTDREPPERHPEDDQHEDGEPEERHAGPADREDPCEVIW